MLYYIHGQDLYNINYFRFCNSHTTSACFALMDPHLRQKMKEIKVWFNRYQTKDDLNISFICSKLRRAKLIHKKLVDRWHVTNVTS